jgi:hypothetical protein
MLCTLRQAIRTESSLYPRVETPYTPSISPMPSQLTTTRVRSTKRKRYILPAVLMRAGTSKGIFVHRHHLPASESSWTGPILAAMGSRNSDARQIDGIGGGTSTTSKVAVISPSTRPGIDVDYTFMQVAVGQEVVDFSGNCGNMCAGVGPFALQEGLVHSKSGAQSVSSALRPHERLLTLLLSSISESLTQTHHG